MQPSFKFQSSYMGTIDYMVTEGTETYRVSVRRSLNDYERSIYNGTTEEIERNLVGAMHLMVRSYRNWEPIRETTVLAFNLWLIIKHEEAMKQLDDNPERYGVIDQDDPIRNRPLLVSGAHYEVDKGWIVDTKVERMRHETAPQ